MKKSSDIKLKKCSSARKGIEHAALKRIVLKCCIYKYVLLLSFNPFLQGFCIFGLQIMIQSFPYNSPQGKHSYKLGVYFF